MWIIASVSKVGTNLDQVNKNPHIPIWWFGLSNIGILTTQVFFFFYWILKSPTEETSWSAWLKHQPIGIQTFVEKILPTIRVDDEQKVHMNQQLPVVIHTHLISLVQKGVIRNIGWNPEISDEIPVCSSLTLHVKGTVRHIYLSSLPPVQSLYNKQTY